MGSVKTVTEYLDDGFLVLYGGVYGVQDYLAPGSPLTSDKYTVMACGNNDSYVGLYSSDVYNRFSLSDIANYDIVSATLYWYLEEVLRVTSTLGCRLEAIEDYGVLDPTDPGVAVYADYGQVMDYDESHPAWKSEDITTALKANLAEDFIAFRWSIMSTPPEDHSVYWYLAAYEEPLFQAYIDIEYTLGNINIGDVWKDIDSMQINIGDDWKEVEGIWMNVNGTWRSLFG